VANSSDPQIPESLAGVTSGIVSLHDFRRQAMHTKRQARPQFTAGGGYYYLSPGDFATIYDLGPLYASGVNGAGQNLAIVARCNIPVSDVQTFRQTFGLPANNPNVIVNGANPGITSEDELDEADLDAQWSGAVAPQATIDFVVSASTQTTDGVDLSAQYIVSHNVAPVMSTSFGSCEQYMGSTELSFYNNLWQQAAAQGITAMVAAGDSGAAGCDSGSEATATGGLAVNGLCSTPYSVCVGGTGFNEGADPGQYWSAGNASNWASALSYIPEVVWNESGSNSGSGLWAGGGGASAFYGKPAWQTGPGVPADGLRDVPDVSLTAAAHDCYLMFLHGSLVGISGTSAASPSFAGLMVLVNQQTGSRQGNANTILYGLAALQGSGGRAYFHDITSGNNAVPGVAGFSARPAYDQASGLGSVDAAVLVNYWTDAISNGAFALALTPGSLILAPGASEVVGTRVSINGGFDAAVVLSAADVPSGVTAVFAPASLAAPGSGSGTLTITASSGAAPGAYTIMVTASAGSATHTFSLPLTISTPGCTLAASVTSFTLNPNSSATTAVSCGSVTGGFHTALNLAMTGAPQGVAMAPLPATVTPGSAQSTVTITAAANAPAGSYTFHLMATGGGLSLSVPISLTINPAPTFTMDLSSTGLSVLKGTSAHVAITTARVGTFNSALALSVTGIPAGITASFSPASMAAPGSGTSTLTMQVGAAPGSYNLTVKAVGVNVTQTAALTLTVTAAPGFSLQAAASTINALAGGPAGTHITASAVNGFTSAVALSVGGVPSGVTVSLSPPQISGNGGTAAINVQTTGSAIPGVYTITITAAGGNVTARAPVVLNIGKLTVTPAATVLTVKHGSSGSVAINTRVTGSYIGSVTLSATGLAKGVTGTFSPASIANPAANASTLTLTTAPTIAPGTYPITVHAVSDGVTVSASLTMTIQ
jgi:pseudomonalisin